MHYINQRRLNGPTCDKGLWLAPLSNATAARSALDELTEKWGQRYPAVIRLWDNAWAEFIPFLDYDVEIRRVICSTNAIVICSAAVSVFHVDHEVWKWSVLRCGCGYLQPSTKQSLESRSACCEGGFTPLVA
jgi:putative transposase